MRVAIAGSSGLIGTELIASLRADGHDVLRLVRRDAGEGESQWDPAKGVIDADAVVACDAVVNLAGASIGDKRLTDSYQQVVLKSRTDSTGLIARTLAQGWDGVLIQGSAMGFYGDCGEEQLSEASPAGDTVLARIVKAWEASAAPAVEAGVRTVFTRTGLVLAPFGGFADRLLPLARRGLLRSLGPGNTWHSWISLVDQVRALRFLMDSDHHGPANIIAPEPTRDADLIASLASAMGKGTLMPVPAWAMRVVVGPAADDLLFSQRATPGVLAALGFTWTHPTIDDATRYVTEQAGLASPTTRRD